MRRISVIVPVYKVEDYLRRCVQSILDQTYSALEVILVDDGSPDGCGAICDEFAAKDSRVKVIHKENGGLSDARNAGLDMATGDYIGFVDSDDHIEPAMYALLLQALEAHDADLSICNFALVDEENVAYDSPLTLTDGVLTRREALQKLGSDGGAYVSYVTAWNRLYRRQLWEGLRFPVGRLHEDEFTAHHILARCKRIATVGQVLYRYVQRRGSITNSRVSVRALDGVYALHDRAQFFLAEGMKPEAVRVLAAAAWKLGQLLGQLPAEAKQEAKKAVKTLLPTLLRRRWKSALLLGKDWLQYLSR